MNNRRFSLVDSLILQVDLAVKGIGGGAQPRHLESPASHQPRSALGVEEKARSASLMRVNHCGEVCAQALYQGQALIASDPALAESMRAAAEEEADHLAWCEQRIKELGGHTSYLNPLWYASSLAIGVIAGALGDRFNLGFLAATEEQVCEHLDDHLQRLPEADENSRTILKQMREDEERHAIHARKSGGATFPQGLKRLMWRASRVMTWTTERI